LSSQRPRPAIGESGHARAPTAETSESTRYVDHHHGQRCWPASAGTSKTGETLRNAHETRSRGYKNTHVVLWGTPALKRRMREKSTPRNRRRPCGKLAKPRKPRLHRDLRHFRVVQALSTGDPSLNVRPDRGHGQIPMILQPILRHTGGSDRQASAFPALLYDAVRGLIPLGCIPLARKNGRCDATRPRRSPFFIRRYAPKKRAVRAGTVPPAKGAAAGAAC
jgi:hypothetical protein